MPGEIISLEADEQKVERAVVSAANQLDAAQKTIDALDHEVNRCYEILAIFEPIVSAYVAQVAGLQLNSEQLESYEIVLDALAALETGSTPEEDRLVREEASNE